MGTGSASNVLSSELPISQFRIVDHIAHTTRQIDALAVSNDGYGTGTKLARRVGLVSGSQSGTHSTLTSTSLLMKNLLLKELVGSNENVLNVATLDYGSDASK